MSFTESDTVEQMILETIHHTPDGGRWETAAAEEWGKKADNAEAKGFSHLAQELRRLSDSYRHDAEREAKSNRFELD